MSRDAKAKGKTTKAQPLREGAHSPAGKTYTQVIATQDGKFKDQGRPLYPKETRRQLTCQHPPGGRLVYIWILHLTFEVWYTL